MSSHLDLSNCPHCGVNTPSLVLTGSQMKTSGKITHLTRWWGVFACARCGGALLVGSKSQNLSSYEEIYPKPMTISGDIPESASKYLKQALETIHAPSGSVMLTASAVDAMLKEKGYKEGNLYSRINKAADDGLITPEMSKWAHEVRLDANEQRHADETIDDPDESDARRCIDFAIALAEFLFVLPARVRRGRSDATTA